MEISNPARNRTFLNETRAMNRELNLEEFDKQSLILKSMPTKAWVSFSEKCNLNCSHCLREKNTIFNGPEMPLDIFHKVEKVLFPFLDICKFGGNNIGEQLIAKDWDYFIDQVEKYSFKSILATNGLLLTKKKITKLNKVGWTIDFSTESATKNTYKDVRGGNFDKFISNVAECCDQKKYLHGTGAIVRLCFTIFYDNVEELTQLITLGAELGVDEILVTHFIPMRERQRNQSLVYHKAMANSTFKEAGSLAQKLRISLLLPKPFPIRKMNELDEKPHNVTTKSSLIKCYHPWTSISINEKGDVFPCCITYIKMGNLRNNSPKEIWNSRKYQKFRKTVNSSAPIEMCRNCSLRGKELTSHLCNNDDALLCIINPINHIIINPTNRVDTRFFFRLKMKELLRKAKWEDKKLKKVRKIYKKLSF